MTTEAVVSREDEALAEIRTAMKGEACDVRLAIVVTFTHGSCIQVEAKPFGGRWTKVGPLLFPPDDGNLGDLLTTLAQMRAEVRS